MSQIVETDTDEDRSPQMKRRRAQFDVGGVPNVGTGWLLLSHVTTLALATACYAIASANMRLYQSAPTLVDLRSTAIFWCVVGLAVIVWTIAAVAATWEANSRVSQPVFADAYFATLYIIIAGCLAVMIWTLVTFARM